MTVGQRKILVIQNDKTDPPHLVGLWLEELGFTVEVIHAYAGSPVPKRVPPGILAVIPLGGHMNANDDANYPWLPIERALLKDAIDRDIPIFAICLGTQLLAVAGGGRVEKADTGEVGVYKVKSNKIKDSIFNFDGELPVAQWHEDIVTGLPAGATRLASSELCDNQIYRIGTNSYGVQFHPEIDLSIVKTWERDADDAFLDSGKATIEPEFAKMESELARVWKPFVQHWGRLVLEQ